MLEMDMSAFEDDFRGDKEVLSTSRLRRLAVLALTEARRNNSLYRTSTKKSLIWAAIGASDNVFERGSYLVARDNRLADWHMTYRYLKQIPDDTLGWVGILGAYSFQWNFHSDVASGVVKEFAVPSVSEGEVDSLHDMLLMNQLREDTVGVKTYDQLRLLEDIGATQVIERPVNEDDITPIEETIIRLDRARAEGRRRQFALRAKSFPRVQDAA